MKAGHGQPVQLDPLGEFNELQTLVRGVLAPAYLLGILTSGRR